MNWEWVVSQGLIEGDAAWYASGKATAEEYANAIKTAYLAADDSNRQQLVDMMWSTGKFEGSKEYWYTDKSGEVGSLETAAMGLATDVGTGAEGAGARFGIAGGAELWKNTDTGESFIVYMVPGTEDDPMYVQYSVASDSDLQSFFGPEQSIVYNKQLSGDATEWSQSLNFGTTTALSNTSENPFASWVYTLETQAKTQPWILDDDFQRLLAASVIEGRDITEAEIAGTNWFINNSEPERAWMLLFNSDPATAQQDLDDQRILVEQYLLGNGLGIADPGLVEYMADNITMGLWSKTEFDEQVKFLTDPYFADQAIDQGLQDYIDDNAITFEQTTDQENEVRSTVLRWLGTNFGQWSDDDVAEWASKIRNDPNAQEALVNTLKDQKQALFPEYDREADYQTIAAPWRTMMRNMWGEVADDSDQVLQSIIRMNDAGEAGKYLTTEGLKRDNDVVTNNVQSALTSTFGGL